MPGREGGGMVPGREGGGMVPGREWCNIMGREGGVPGRGWGVGSDYFIIILSGK